jgi:carbamoyltransferase
MEFGPRALGARSILGDARSAAMRSRINLKIKYRESFRPFAPSVLEEKIEDYFELDRHSPYMLLVAKVKKNQQVPVSDEQERGFGIERLNAVRSTVPAITHVDHSARVQSVSAATNPSYHRLIAAFDEKYGCPVIVNTSFNVRGEPIVCSPEDAYRCFMRTEMDHLVMGRCLLDKTRQNARSFQEDRRPEFELS